MAPTNIVLANSHSSFDSSLKALGSRLLWRNVALCLWVSRNFRGLPAGALAKVGLIRKQIADWQSRALTRICVVAGCHLNCGVSKLSAPGEDSIALDDGIAKKLSQFVNFLLSLDSVAL